MGVRLLVTLVALAWIVGTVEAESTRLLMQPTVHGDRVAFRHGGDLWVASIDGGRARRLTTSEGIEDTPRFSPDGTQIAFTGQYEGRNDVYVVSADGGEPRRLTYHPGSDILVDWTPDGTGLVFASGRDNPPRNVSRLWTISIEGGMPEVLPLYAAFDGDYTADGTRLAYVPTSPAFTPGPGATTMVGWKHYRGGRTSRIRIVEMDDLSVEDIPRENSNDIHPMWVGDRVYFLSDREGTMNLFSYDGESVRRHTWHEDFDAKSADSDGESIVYEQGGYLYHFDTRSGQMRRIEIEIRGDFPWMRPRFEKVNDSMRSVALSPTGVRAVIGARGEIFTAPAEKGDVRSITDSPAVHDRSPAWSPDGEHIAWFSDAGGEYRLMIGDQDGLSPAKAIPLEDEAYFYAPAWSPDSKYLMYADNYLNLRYVDIESGESTKIDTDLFGTPPADFDAVWSPDSKWIAYSRRLPNKMGAIFMYSIETGERSQVTDGLSDAVSPAFDAGGKYLYFLASTDYALNVGWLDMTSYEREFTRGVYLAVLSKDDPSPLLPESDEETVNGEEENDAAEKTAEDSAKPSEDDSGEDESSEEPDEKAEDSDKTPEVRVDFDHLGQRIIAVDVPEETYVALVAGRKNVFFYAQVVDGKLRVNRYDLKKRENSTFVGGIDDFALSHDGKKLLYRKGNSLTVVDATKEKANGGDTLDLGGMQARVDPAVEWPQIFHETWRIMRDFFYDPELHGVDWPAMYEKYSAWLPSVHHRSELTYLNALMLSEVVAGHTRTGGGEAPSTEFVPVGLLGADFEQVDGRFRIARILHGENWNPDLRAPLSGPGIDVTEGDYLIAVNGKELDGGNLYAAFEGTANKQTVLRVSAQPDGSDARDVTVVPVASDYGLRQRQWMEDNRKKVDELSDGRLAYVYLPNTAQAGYTNFNRYYYAQQDKLGAVIDERFNGGGKVADYIVEFIDRPLMSMWASRNGRPFTSPNAAIFGPKVMIVNEWAGSGGDYMPWAFKKRGVGPLIGQRTWGGLIGVSAFPRLMDGGFTTAPSFAIYSPDPDDPQWIVENVGVTPDIEVDILPADVAAGRDPQLERAVQECLRLLRQNPVQLPERPAPIDRVRQR